MTEATPRITVYSRPSCGYCDILRAGLDAASIPYDEVTITFDDAARALVRSVNDGNETVPTVIIGSRVLTNPSVDEVRRAAGLW